MGRPVYTPKMKIKTGLYTSGKEWMDAETNEEYKGFYHIYPNNAVYSQADFTELSVELIKYTPAIEGVNNSIYFKLTGTRFDNYTHPKYYLPELTDKDYKKANFKRFFVQRKNDLSQIIEVSGKDYARINKKNKEGIDSGQYNKESINWTISGPIEIVEAANARVISNSSMVGLSLYLTNLSEFYRTRTIASPGAKIPNIPKTASTPISRLVSRPTSKPASRPASRPTSRRSGGY